MRQPKIEKVVVNIGVGEAGERLVKAQKVLEMVTRQKPEDHHRQGHQPRPGRQGGHAHRVHGHPEGREGREVPEEGAERSARTGSPSYSFDPEGNLSFGMPITLTSTGMKYDPEIGIFGMDVNVVIQRPGTACGQAQGHEAHAPQEPPHDQTGGGCFHEGEVQRRGGRVKPKKQFGRSVGLHALRQEEGHSQEVWHAPVQAVLPRDRSADRIQEVFMR